MPNFPLLSNNTFSLATSFFYSQHRNAAEKALEIVDSRSLNKRDTADAGSWYSNSKNR